MLFEKFATFDPSKYQNIDEEGGPGEVHQILPGVTTNDITRNAKNSALLDYLKLTNANHKKDIKITKLEICRDSLPVALAYTVGGIATLPYLSYGKEAAQGNDFNYYMNPLGAVVLNTIVNGYFFHLVISPIWENIFKKTPKDLQQALYNLQDKNPALYARIFRATKEVGLGLLVLMPAILSAYPFYALDKAKSEHPEWLSQLVLLAATMLQYKGVEAIFYRLIPAILSLFKKLYRRYNYAAMKDHKIMTAVSALKAAHLDALERAYQEFLRQTQMGELDELAPFIELRNKPNPHLDDSCKLLFEFLKSGSGESFQPSSIGRIIIQSLSLIVTTASLPGYFLLTKESAADYLQLHNPAKEWTVGSLIFFISVALSYDVSWDVCGSLYNLSAAAFNGMKQSWRESNGLFDFVKKAWHGKFNLGSWYQIVKLPLSIQQNPRLMLSIMGLFYTLSYWSTQTSTYLNEEELGKKTSHILELSTIIAVMLFNSFPVDKILGSIQRCIMKFCGSQANQDQLRIEQLLQSQSELIDKMDDIKFLEVLNDLGDTPVQDPAQAEALLKTFCGNKNSSQIFGAGHKYADKPLASIIHRLKDKGIEKLSAINGIGFFPSRAHRKANINSDYGTLKLVTTGKTLG